jgi:hypothetical protein
VNGWQPIRLFEIRATLLRRLERLAGRLLRWLLKQPVVRKEIANEVMRVLWDKRKPRQ